MPFIKVYVHFVWSTKNRYPFLNSKEIRAAVWQHIKENAQTKGIFVDFVNGYSDHCHCLVSMNMDQTIQKTMQLIKGESSFWINKTNLTNYMTKNQKRLHLIDFEGLTRCLRYNPNHI